LRQGDIVRGFNHQPIYNPQALLEYIKKHSDETLTLEVERSGSKLEVPVKPVPLPTEETEGKVTLQPRIGIQWDASGQMSIAHPSPLELIYNSVTSTLNTLGAVASPKSDVKIQHLSGPIGIGRIYYLFFVSERGWQLALWLSVVLNVNLAILNMLPIPVLDGGHILFGLIESVRRKPLNMRVLEVVQGVCTVLIVGMIIYITFFDLQDLPFVKHALDKYAPQSAEGQRSGRALSELRQSRAAFTFGLMDPSMTTTAFELPGYRVVKTFGVVRGSSCVRARFSARSARDCRLWLAATSRS